LCYDCISYNKKSQQVLVENLWIFFLLCLQKEIKTQEGIRLLANNRPCLLLSLSLSLSSCLYFRLEQLAARQREGRGREAHHPLKTFKQFKLRMFLQNEIKMVLVQIWSERLHEIGAAREREEAEAHSL
jgi:hypothetical protein